MVKAVTYDEGKPMWQLVPLDALDSVVQVWTQACTRPERPYPPRNWEGGMEYGRVFGALLRHARDFQTGHRVDPETNLPVMAHLSARALQLLTYQVRNVGVDDLPRHVRHVVQHSWQPLDQAVTRGSNIPVTLLNRSALEPGKWVVRAASGATWYIAECDLLLTPPA